MSKLGSPKEIAKLTTFLRKVLLKECVGVRNSATASLANHQNVTWESARPFEEIPSDIMLPFIGTAWTSMPIIGRYRTDRLHLANRDKKKRLGGIFREKAGKYNAVISFSGEDLESILRSEGAYPSRGELSTIKAYRESRKQWYSSTGLMVLNGHEWAVLRNKIQKHLLKPKAVQAYLEPLRDVSRDFVRRIFDVKDSNNEVPDLLHELYKWSLESVSLVGLDTRLGCLEKNLSPDSDGMKMIQSVNTQFECMNQLEAFAGNFPFWKFFPTPTWKKFERASDMYAEIAFKYVNKAVDDLKHIDGNKQLTLLQSMLAKKDLDVADAMVFVADMLMAGIETTSHTIGFLLYHLARNPEKQEILYQEIMKQLPTEDIKLNSSVYESLKYTKACLKESIRILPIIGGTVRVLASDAVLSGFQVPSGTIAIALYDELYMDERRFKNPGQYLPERWLNKDDRPDPFSFIPFGFGPRSCIGKRLAEVEMITLITEIIRNFRVEYHLEDIGFYTKTVNTPDKPLRYNFIQR